MDTKALRQKILDLAIRGKLVPQDPNDEPAEVLLERIREQKQQMLKEGKLKKKDIKNDTIIFKGEDNLHYEKFQDGTVKCIEDEIPFEVPEGWSWARLGVLAQYKKGPFGSSITKAMFIPDSPNAVKVYEQKNAINKDATLGNYYISVEKYESLKSFEVFPNDIIVSCAGTIGENFVLPIGMRKGIINQALMKISLFDLEIMDFYLMYFDFKLKSAAQEQGHGIALKNIPPFDVLKKYLVPIPPIQEQHRIVTAVNNVVSKVDFINADSAAIHNLISQAKAKILDLAIRGKLVPQDPNDEPASVLIERIRAEKEELIKQGKIKRNKKESVIFKGDDNSYYEKIDGEVSCIDVEIPYDIPDTWTWMRLENCCVKEIRRGKSPKYAEISNVIVFAQKCNTKYNGIDISLAQYLDETTLKRYPTDEYMQDGDVVINSTGTGTLGRVGIYRDGDNTTGLSVVPDSHVTIIRGFSCICPYYLYAYIKAHQSELEKKGEGSTNQKELKPLTLKEMLIAIPPLSEQKRIDKMIDVAFRSLAVIEENLN
ncbi:MAG: hypothetical protein BHW06_11375 [Clostridium sp. 44_14]|nr:MAG: hypothetical protein BHW06_11375 [Clostridium sp. 44_14]